MKNSFFQFRQIGIFSPAIQIALIVILYLCTVLYAAISYQQTGTFFSYPPHWSFLFVPIYEEILFRGFILEALLKKYGKRIAIIVSSFLFGIWHLKNFTHFSNFELFIQFMYTAFLAGPLAAYFAIKFQSIWIIVIIHYLHNLLLPLFLFSL